MSTFLKVLRVALAALFAGITAGVLFLAGAYLYLGPRLPSVESLKNVHFQVPLRVYTSGGKLMAEFGERRRLPVKLDQVPPLMIDAFLSAEDSRFYEHPGISYRGLLRAVWVLLTTGHKEQGGSTITMQVARN
ncbi:MAG: transglycosylase domain-containing protein, partial [Gammaproteobacteria bacterium]|nr:transglycosylase domain-containing protein [Gammaproteobacteria bacterium]